MRAAFLVDYVVSAGALALWVYARWPFTPSLKLLGAHFAVAIVALNVIGAVGGAPAVVVALTFGALVYAFLVAVWGLAILRDVAGLHR